MQLQQLRDVPLPEEEGADHEEDLEVSDEDLEFVKNHGESLGFLKDLNKAELDRCAHVHSFSFHKSVMKPCEGWLTGVYACNSPQDSRE